MAALRVAVLRVAGVLRESIIVKERVGRRSRRYVYLSVYLLGICLPVYVFSPKTKRNRLIHFEIHMSVCVFPLSLSANIIL